MKKVMTLLLVLLGWMSTTGYAQKPTFAFKDGPVHGPALDTPLARVC